MADHDSLIEQFRSISGVEDERARFYLESAAWNLETALGSFYENAEGDADASAVAAMDTDPIAAAMATDPITAAAIAPATMPKPIKKTPVIFDDDASDEDEDEEQQAFYAGGSQHSGQQVLGPAKKKKDIVSQLFKSARENQVERNVDGAGGSDQPKKLRFGGTGYRLGETEDDTQVVPDLKNREKPPRDVILKMWRTGFTVDDGPLREFTDPTNAAFLNAIKRGEIPIELTKEAKGGEVYLNLEDHRHEEYVAPRKATKAFTGSGNTLGSPAPTVIGQVLDTGTPGGATGSTAITKSPEGNEEKAKENLKLDADKPSTNIQVKLTDGSRLIIKLNHTHTVEDLRNYIQTARPQYQNLQFALFTTFPHAELTEGSKTVADAKLINSTIVIKMK